MIDLDHCPNCEKPVASGHALTSHLAYAHGVEDPVSYLVDLENPHRLGRLMVPLVKVGKIGAVALAAVAVDALVSA